MQYARALERTKAILEAGFELIECWEHDFHESTIYLKKNTETVRTPWFTISSRGWTKAINANR